MEMLRERLEFCLDLWDFDLSLQRVGVMHGRMRERMHVTRHAPFDPTIHYASLGAASPSHTYPLWIG